MTYQNQNYPKYSSKFDQQVGETVQCFIDKDEIALKRVSNKIANQYGDKRQYQVAQAAMRDYPEIFKEYLAAVTLPAMIRDGWDVGRDASGEYYFRKPA